MTNFDRGLDNEFVKALNDEYNKEGSWWRNLVDDRELFIAIRNNYLNVYYRGGSVLKLNWLPSERKMIGEIHYKYLLKPSMPRKDQLIKIEDGRPILPPDPECLFLDGLDDVGGLKNAVRCYTGAEKEGIHAFVFRDKNPDVVDLEIAIDDGKGRKQIDLAAIHDIDRSGSFKLVFYEVKHFGNKELRTKTGTIPVVDQMSRYSEAIAQNHDELVDSYRKVCGN
ncbi:MAG: hypothetical protein OXC93_05335, partial [Rhodospirillaceae bacterium]|nr:hypothetical protein [Rhodospirillaceae bacterium]